MKNILIYLSINANSNTVTIIVLKKATNFLLKIYLVGFDKVFIFWDEKISI
jgi:hypothetical protein